MTSCITSPLVRSSCRESAVFPPSSGSAMSLNAVTHALPVWSEMVMLRIYLSIERAREGLSVTPFPLKAGEHHRPRVLHGELVLLTSRRPHELGTYHLTGGSTSTAAQPRTFAGDVSRCLGITTKPRRAHLRLHEGKVRLHFSHVQLSSAVSVTCSGRRAGQGIREVLKKDRRDHMAHDPSIFMAVCDRSFIVVASSEASPLLPSARTEGSRQ